MLADQAVQDVPFVACLPFLPNQALGQGDPAVLDSDGHPSPLPSHQKKKELEDMESSIHFKNLFNGT